MFLATTYDKSSEAWTKFSPNVEVLRRMASYARSSADLLTNLIQQGQTGPYTWECLFRTPMNNYDAVVLLHRDKLSYPRRLLFPNEISLGKQIIQEKASKEFKPFLELDNIVECSDDARSKLLVNFDPSRFFLLDLKEEFPEMFKIWYDALGGDTIGLTWELKKRKRNEEDDSNQNSHVDVLKCVGELGKGFVRSVHLLKVPRLEA
ncbi:hypothetical protein HPP92_009475 [Vanilla planifolia]|uniref:Uncharacterized protein n=1 Tax=Vanilla planifolia TaxID=51239 RepID=A0A835V700_VANPL|nr:hypothetical protein HPP92_009475 [Vanilla planifolia]